MEIDRWEYSGIQIEGLSLAGIRTSLALPQYSIAFDVAQGLPHAIGMNDFFITHGHMDHAAGIPYIISQKAMNSHVKARFIMPLPMVGPLNEIMHQWSKIEGHEYNYEFIGIGPGDEIHLKSKTFVRPFKTFHRIPSQGYSLCRRFTKLRKELAALSQEELTEVRLRGESLTEEKIQTLVSFTGDTKIEFLDHNPEVLTSKILIMEATYLDKKKTVESAREWGHTHLEEIIPRLNQIKSERIVLNHSSARYSLSEAQRIMSEIIPPEHQHRVILFPGR